jgi:hypothetical protein
MKNFHLNLTHLNSSSEYFLMVGGQSFSLIAHTAESLLATTHEFHVLRWNCEPEAQIAYEATHYCQVNKDVFSKSGLQLIQLVKKDKSTHTNQIVRLSFHIDENVLENYFINKLRVLRGNITDSSTESQKDRPVLLSAILEAKGIKQLPEDENEAVKLLVSTNTIINEQTTASVLVGINPPLLSTLPAVTTKVLHDHILCDSTSDPTQVGLMAQLTDKIKNAGENWCPNVECTNADGTPIKAEYDYEAPDGTGWKTGDIMYRADPSDSVISYVKAPLLHANQTASNNSDLSRHIGGRRSGQATETLALSSLAQNDTSGWTLSSYSYHHGIKVEIDESSSIKNLVINVSNRFQRSLFVGYQLRDSQGNKINEPVALDYVPPVDHFAGIPLSIDPIQFNVKMDEVPDAAEVELIFGSLGIGEWENPFSLKGAVSTGVFQIAMPIICSMAGAWIKTTGTYKAIMNSPQIKAALVLLAAPLTAEAADFDAKKTFDFFKHQGLSIFSKAGFEILFKFIAKQIAEKTAIAAAMGPGGIVYKTAGLIADAADMVVTTCECLSSPATVRITAKRSVDVKINVTPDPKHGEWPLSGKNWRANLSIQGLSGQILSGNLPPGNSQIELNFYKIPYGAVIQIAFIVEAENGWIAGTACSDATKAIPINQGEVINLKDISIIENLIPLNKDSHYMYVAKTSKNNKGYPIWDTEKPLGNVSSSNQNLFFSYDNLAHMGIMGWIDFDRTRGQYDPNMMVFDLVAPTGSITTNNMNTMVAKSLLDSGDNIYVGFDSLVVFPVNRYDVYQGKDLRYDKVYSSLTGMPKFHGALFNVKSEATVVLDLTNDKLLIVPMNKQYDQRHAPSPIICSGRGSRSGLVDGLVEGAVTSDGRILVLEQTNRRVQAFDSSGSPVQCFPKTMVVGKISLESWTKAKSIAEKIDILADIICYDGQTSATVLSVEATIREQLDSRVYSDADALVMTFRNAGVDFAYDPENLQDATKSTQIEVIERGKDKWNLRDPRGIIWRVLNVSTNYWGVYLIPNKSEITEIKANTHWQVRDYASGLAWDLNLQTQGEDENMIYVRPLLSYFELAASYDSTTFLDIAVEATGYIYILGYYKSDQFGQPKADTYFVKVFDPSGKLLFETPKQGAEKDEHIIADKFFVDDFRTLYAMSYDKNWVIRSSGDTSDIYVPQVTKWSPSPPPSNEDLEIGDSE